MDLPCLMFLASNTARFILLNVLHIWCQITMPVYGRLTKIDLYLRLKLIDGLTYSHERLYIQGLKFKTITDFD